METKLSAQIVHSQESIRRSSPLSRQDEKMPSHAPVKSSKFKRSLLKDDLFVDPASEIALLVPEKNISSNFSQQLVFERQFSELQAFAKTKTPSKKMDTFFSSIYEYLFALFSKAKKKLKGRRARMQLTKKGEETLAQLRYLALLCDATEFRTPEDILEAESAFGQAYYEIKTLSSNLEKMREEEQIHHIDQYSRHMAKLLSIARD